MLKPDEETQVLEVRHSEERHEVQSISLCLASLLLILGLGYGLWQLMQEPAVLASSLSGSHLGADEGPIIASSPNRIEPEEGGSPAKIAAPGEPLSGIWTYTINPGEAPAKWSYAAQFVHLELGVQNGKLSGTYRSRYKIPDQTNQAELNFEFSGAAKGRRFDWVNRQGKGEIYLSLQAGGVMNVSWKAHRNAGVGGLAAGSTSLVRRSDSFVRR
jgi:hypothetical protein